MSRAAEMRNVTGGRLFPRGCVLRFARCAGRSPRPGPRRPVREMEAIAGGREHAADQAEPVSVP